MKKFFRSISSYIRQTDKWLWFLCLSLSAFSVVLICGIAYSGLVDIGLRKILVQIGATGLGGIAAIILSKLDYHEMARLWKLHAPLAYLLVILTFFFGVGAELRPDDKSWFVLPGGFTFQPTEILKISFIITLAYHLHILREQLNRPHNILAVCAHGAAPILLVHLQGDDGTALVFAVIFAGMVFAAGINWKYIAGAIAAAIAAFPFIWFFILSDFQRQRFLILLQPHAADPQGDYYQQYWANLAIGSGKVWGKGIFSGSHRYVPEMHNDFIFSFIGESLGFVGSLAVVLVITLLCVRVLSDAQMAQDLQGKLICVGVFSMISFQVVVNIGMCLSLLPVIGITLPFLSSGGSSVLASYMGIGLVLSVYMHTLKNLFSK